MANYNLVTNSTFQPFTYDILTAPIEQLEKKYEEVELGIDTLYNKSLPIGSVLTASDETQKKQYENYLKDLSDLSDELAKEGYNRDLARKLINAKNNYTKIIVPIESAVKSRATQIEKQAEGFEKDPTIRYSYQAESTPLQNYINNPNLRYKSYSGEKLSEIGKEIATHFMNDYIGTTYSPITGLPGLLEVNEIYGYTPQEMLEKIKNNPNDSIIAGFIDRALEMSGISKWEGIQNDNGDYTELGISVLKDVLDNVYRGAAKSSDRKITSSVMKDPNYKVGEPDTKSIVTRSLPFEVDSSYQQLKEVYDSIIDKNTNTLSKDYGENIDVALAAYQEFENAKKEIKKQQIPAGLDKYSINKLVLPKIMAKYGISKVLSDNEYNIIRPISFKSQYPLAEASFETMLLDELNKSAKQNTAYSINLADYDQLKNKFKSSITSWNNTGNRAGMITDMNKKNIDYNNIKDGTITNIEYSPLYEDKFVVTMDNGMYLVDPSIFGSQVKSLISEMHDYYNRADSDTTKEAIIYQYLGRIIDVLNAYNPVAPTTSKAAGI